MRFRYYILFTRTEKQETLLAALAKTFPEERGMVFLPRMEYWRRQTKEIALKPLFPGYLFIYTDMEAPELHRFVAENRKDVIAFTKELGRQEAELVDKLPLEEKSTSYRLADLTEEETEFLNVMLDGEGIERMSVGYRETNGKLVVMEGPLKLYEDRIVKVERHNRVAYLDFAFREMNVTAGLEIKPKQCFFPEDTDAPALLKDGTEVDLLELKKRMMGE